MRRISSRAARWFALGTLTAVMSFGFLSQQVQAHSALDSTSPADQSVVSAPTFVTLTFNEQVSGARIVVRDQFKKVVPTKIVRTKTDEVVSVRPLLPLSKGLYKVVWRVRSSDGHYISGVFVFRVI